MTFQLKPFLFVSIFSLISLASMAQVSSDTVKLDLKGAEKRFLEQNLEVLIAKTNIDEAKGMLLQSKLWENPEVDLNREFYNFETKKILTHNSHTQFDVQYSQLITTGGKYFKGIQIAKQNVKLNEYELYDVMRALKLEVRENFYELQQDQQKALVIQNGIAELSKQIEAINIQVQKGNVARKELIRLQSLMLDFMNEQTEIANSIVENQSDLKQLLNYKGKEYLVVLNDEAKELPARVSNLTFDSLETTAFANRYDLLETNLKVDIGKNEIQRAKMEGVPDLHLGAQYDRAGTGGEQYTGLLVSMPLPLWNHNEGNIKAAKAEYAQLQLEKEKKFLEVHNDLQEEYLQLLNKANLYKSATKDYNSSFEEIYKNIYDSYKNRTIGLIEFLEYFESYKDTKFQLIDIETQLKKQAQQINYETGKDIL